MTPLAELAPDVARDECPHDRYRAIGPTDGAFPDDHLFTPIYCHECGSYLGMTEFRTDRPTEFSPLDHPTVARLLGVRL